VFVHTDYDGGEILMIRINKITGQMTRWPRILKLFSIISLFLIIFGAIIHFVEPQTFPSIFEGIWWALVTISTIGYGDYSPSTVIGRLVGIVLIFTGAGLVTSYFATVAAMTASSEQQYKEGKKVFEGKNHFVIIGWNERSRGIIEEIHMILPQQEVVLIDESLPKHPRPRTNIHFIKGKATVDAILLKANIQHAAKVLVTADLKQDEFQTDMFSILTLLAIKGLQPDILCLVEILTKEQKENARRAGADRIIETNKFAGEYMLSQLLHGESIQWDFLADRSGWTEMAVKEIHVNEGWEGLSYRELSHVLLEDSFLLTGIKREGNYHMKPSLDTIIRKQDILLVM
jgi:voltage-gated potassium channel